MGVPWQPASCNVKSRTQRPSLQPAVRPQVQPKHVKEAFRLLNKSIIRVDSPDINFDNEEDEQEIHGTRGSV